MGQLIPGLRKSGCKLIRVFMKTTGDLSIRWIHPQRDVRGEHDGSMLFLRIVGIRHQISSLGIGWNPLEGSRRALGQIPVILEQGIKVAVVPGDGCRCPGSFETTADGIAGIP